MLWRFDRATVDLKERPDDASQTVSQGVYGEALEVLDAEGGWTRVRNRRDAYEGHVRSALIVPRPSPATHQVQVRNTLLFEAPDIKSSVVSHLPYSSELALPADAQGTFARVDSGGFVWLAHCTELDSRHHGSLVDAALELFAGAPYLWGGRSPQGCDCSALVQLAALACGFRLPRDSGDQEGAITRRVSYDERSVNDLVFWPGHVAILVDKDTVVHATAHSLQACRERLVDVMARAGEPSSLRRLAR